MKIKKRLAAVLAALILLSACRAQPASNIEAPPTVFFPPVWEGQHSSEIVLAIYRDASDTLIEAATYFAEQLGIRTNGSLVARVEMTVSPDTALLTGLAQIALLCERRQLEFCQPLAATATPFLYHGVQNFLMRANADTTMNILEFSLRENHGLVPLVAFFQGAQHLLVDFPSGGYSHFLGASILVSPYQGTHEPLTRLTGPEGQISYYDTGAERLESFLQGQANVAQVAAADLADTYQSFIEPASLIVSYHDLTPAWLIADAQFMDSLPSRWRAHIAELQAEMSSKINSAYQRLEEDILRELNDGWVNLSVVHEFSHTRNRVFNTMPDLEHSASAQQRLARDLVEIMRRTA